MDDAKCLRCGRCCYEKLMFNGRVFNTSRPCKHLDEATKLCRVYEHRFEVNPRCLSVPEGIKLGVFPADCPYVAGLSDYVPPVDKPLTRALLRRVAFGEVDTPEELERLALHGE